MDYKPSTIGELFDSKISFTIPVYQRAYSWDDKNWKVFLEDIEEQLNINGGNSYSYGNILLENHDGGLQYEVIDGQQRLTTLIIFMRAFINVMREKGWAKDEIEDIENDFIKRKGNIVKLRPVDYDRACFDTIIIENAEYSIKSNSQEKYQQCKDFFTKELSKLSPDELKKIKEIIYKTKINRLELHGKQESALMFELQNNRGKDLTNLEKLKSYFMYETYVNSPSTETESNVELISNYFKEIYKTVYDIKDLNEDSILIYHCNAWLNGFSYRNLDDIKNEYKKTADKANWIRDFCRELSESFNSLKQLESNSSNYYRRLRDLVREKQLPAFVYPFIIKGYKFFGDKPERLDLLFHLMEVLAFRYYLISTRADFSSRLSDVLREFNGDIIHLRDSLKKKLNFSYYWDDIKMKDVLGGRMYDNPVLHYLLWQYEDHIQNKGYHVGTCRLENEQIEHISPQTPPQGESLAAGYDVDQNNLYSDEFCEKYLNCVGNLMLISRSHNASIGNKPFKEKLATYVLNPLLRQQAEIKEFLDDTESWKTEQIIKRQSAIVGFAVSRWSFDSVVID